MDPQEQQQVSVPQQPVQQQTEEAVFPGGKHHSLIWTLVILFFLTILIGAGMFVLPKTTLFQSLLTATPPSPTGVVSGKNQAKTIDMSPSVPANQKTVVLIELSDSSFEKVIMANALVTVYIKNLPEGDRVISQTPLSK